MAESGTSCTGRPHQQINTDTVCSGSVAPINRVAADGFKLSLLLNAVSSDVTNAGLEVQAISKGVTQFAMMLKHTSQVLQAANSVHSQEAVETAQSIADEGTRAFDEINDMVERVRTAQRGVRRRSPGGTGGRPRRLVRRSSWPGSGPARP